jgi:hypothetical protein
MPAVHRGLNLDTYFSFILALCCSVIEYVMGQHYVSLLQSYGGY